MCNEVADTREHKFKRSDVARVADRSAPGRAVFLGENGFQTIQGPRSVLVKFGKVLCQNCNTTRSQPYDHAYERFSNWIANDGVNLLNRVEIDFRAIYQEFYQEQVLFLLRYLAKHLGCRIADEGYPVPNLLKATFINTDLTPFDVSFAVNSTWAKVPGAEDILENYPLVALRDSNSGQILGHYISGFSIGYLTIIYRYDFPIYLPWEEERIGGARQFVRLGRYERGDDTVFRIGSHDYKIPVLSEQQKRHIFEHRPHEKMSDRERLEAWLTVVYLILLPSYPELSKQILRESLTIPLCQDIWHATFLDLERIFR
jgi:hypothetical protein